MTQRERELEARVTALTAENERLRAENRSANAQADLFAERAKNTTQQWRGSQERGEAAESRLATAMGLIDAYMADDDYDAQGCINRVRAALDSAQPAAPARTEAELVVINACKVADLTDFGYGPQLTVHSAERIARAELARREAAK